MEALFHQGAKRDKLYTISELSRDIEVSLQSVERVIFFTKVQKGYRVIKLYVRNFAKKELMELSDLFVPAGSRTLFDLNFLQFSLFFQELCEGESHFFCDRSFISSRYKEVIG